MKSAADIQTLGKLLRDACRDDDTDSVRGILESVPDEADRLALLSVQDKYGESPLHTAALLSTDKTVTLLLNSVCREEMLKLLLALRTSGRTPLHASARNNRPDTACLQLLRFLLTAYKTDKSQGIPVCLSVFLSVCLFISGATSPVDSDIETHSI